MGVDISLASQFDKLPPHSLDAEMSLLGSILAADRAVMARVRSIVSRDSFYEADHQIIFDAICRVSDAGQAVDIRLVVEAPHSTLLRRWLLVSDGCDPQTPKTAPMSGGQGSTSINSTPSFTKRSKQKENYHEYEK